METFDFEPLGEFIAQAIRESILEVYRDDFQYVEKYLPLYTDKKCADEWDFIKSIFVVGLWEMMKIQKGLEREEK